MIKHLLNRQVLNLLLMLVFFNSCNGQIKTKSTDNLKKIEPISVGKPKLEKMQGSHKEHNVNCSLRDKNGNLWFGTTGEGVYRYEGKLFTKFTVKDGLSSNCVSSILEDRNGNIWFGTDDGLSVFDGQQIITVSLDKTNYKKSISKKKSINNSKTRLSIECIMQSRTGKLWFGTNVGVYCYDGEKFSIFLDNDSIINKDKLLLENVESIMEDKNGNIWFGSGVNEGVYLYNGKSLVRPFSSILLDKFNNKRIMCIIEDKNGIIWFGAGAGTFFYDGKNLTNITEQAPIYWTYSIFEDSIGNLWFATEKGSGKMDEAGGVWCFNGKIFTQFTTKEGLINNGVFCTVEDNDGNLWFGTRNTSLSRYNGKNFTTFSE